MKSSYFLSLDIFRQYNGNLGVVEENRTIPFSIRRCFFIYDMKTGDVRGKHAVNNEQCILLLSGECTVMVHDGKKQKEYHLSKPMEGVYVPAMLWREVCACTPGSSIAVFSDKYYDTKDYIREFDAFLQYMNLC